MRVLYSFPHRIGAGRICHTAWQQAAGLASAGAEVTVLAGSIARPLPAGIEARTTLSFGPARAPVRLLGRRRACALHDQFTAGFLARNHARFDVVHAWPLGALRTLEIARRHEITSFLERPNAHTAFAYEAVAEEHRRLGFDLPPDHDHTANAASLALEEREYALADRLLCPSDFVARTFLERGTPAEKITRHRYGYEAANFSKAPEPRGRDHRFTALYAGVGEPRKGLHHILDAWFAAGAHEQGRLLVCGTFVPHYLEALGDRIHHPSIEVLGHRHDLPDLLRLADVFVLSSIEEGSALVTYEAMAGGCALLVSSSTGAPCRHGIDSLIHEPRDVATLTEHFRLVLGDRQRLEGLRQRAREAARTLDWSSAGAELLSIYSAHRTSRTLRAAS